MAFPFNYCIKIKLNRYYDPEDRQLFIKKISKELRKQRASEIIIKENRIQFSGSLLFSFFYYANLTEYVTHGEIDINSEKNNTIISCKLFFKRITIIPHISAPLVVAVIYFVFYPEMSFIVKFCIIFLSYFLSVGFTHIFPIFKFILFTKKLKI